MDIGKKQEEVRESEIPLRRIIIHQPPKPVPSPIKPNTYPSKQPAYPVRKGDMP